MAGADVGGHAYQGDGLLAHVAGVHVSDVQVDKCSVLGESTPGSRPAAVSVYMGSCLNACWSWPSVNQASESQRALISLAYSVA